MEYEEDTYTHISMYEYVRFENPHARELIAVTHLPLSLTLTALRADLAGLLNGNRIKC